MSIYYPLNCAITRGSTYDACADTGYRARYSSLGTQGATAVCAYLSCGRDGARLMLCSVRGIIFVHGGNSGACEGPPPTAAAAAAASGGPDTTAAVGRLRPRRPESPARRTPQRLAQHATTAVLLSRQPQAFSLSHAAVSAHQ